MTTVGIFDAKNRLSEPVERAARGEEIVITRRGERVARPVPPRPWPGRNHSPHGSERAGKGASSAT